MGGWSNATRQGGWNYGNWNHVRREDKAAGLPSRAARWTKLDVALTIGAFAIGREFGLVAFVAFKLWHQASGFDGSIFAFARDRWEKLVGVTQAVLSSGGVAMPFGARRSGNHAFDTWRETELTRIEAERGKLRSAEREFAAYRDELLHAKDREDFDRFMQARGLGPAN